MDNDSREEFFSSIDAFDAEGAVALLEGQIKLWRSAQLKCLADRSDLPRNEKARSHELLEEANSFTSLIKRGKALLAVHRERAERKERHSLWVEAVTAVAGSEVLAQVQAYMKSSRKVREVLRNPPKQPPVDDAHVASGCRLFSDSTKFAA